MNTIELYMLAEKQNHVILDFRMDCIELKSFCICDEDRNCHIAIDYDRIKDKSEEKTILAHEVGHCETGAFYNQYATCDIQQKHEIKADKWAIEHLIPADALDDAVALGYTDFWSLAEYFNVSEDFIRKAVCWHTYGNLDVKDYINQF